MLDDLKEWSINFIKHKDIFTGKLIDFKIEDNLIEFNFKDRKQLYVIMPLLNESIKRYLKEGYVSVVCLNKRENVKFLIVSWNLFIKYSKLNFIFVNPKLNEKWGIYPSMHHFVAEKESFALGIKSLFETVPEVK